MKVDIKKSTNTDKKLMAIFNDGDKKIKTVHFGSELGSSYIDHKDDKIKNAWIARHKVRGTFNDYKSASSLAFHILWSEKNITNAIRKYKQKFNLS